MIRKEVTAAPIGISMQTVTTYRPSAFRRFLPGERHITRVESGDVLLLMLEGTLRFTEEGGTRRADEGGILRPEEGTPSGRPREQ